MDRKIRVLIVDDSALVRQVLSQIMSADPQLEVVGTAPDPFVARERIKALKPDVITLDVEMPRMDGITFLRNLMRLHPLPVLMISSLTERGADVTLQALELGAVDFITKPTLDVAQGLESYSDELVAKVKATSRASVHALTMAREVAPKLNADAVLKQSTAPRYRTTERLIAIGASTGGTEAIKAVLCALPADMPGIVVTQHIPPAFSAPFAKRLDGASALRVSEAEDGQHILHGHAYIAPGGKHLAVARDGARYVCRVLEGPPVNRHCPSVDVLFRSVAQHAGPNALGVILTGMGDDGAQGLLELKQSGAWTLAQDEKTSVVWGMPGEAVKRGAAEEVLPLERIAPRLMSLAHETQTLRMARAE